MRDSSPAKRLNRLQYMACKRNCRHDKRPGRIKHRTFYPPTDLSVKRPVLNSVQSFVRSAVSLTRAAICSILWRVGSLSYTPRAGICLVVGRVGSIPYTPRPGICLVVWRVESLFHMPRAGVCLVHKRLGRFSSTPNAVSSPRSLGGESLLHGP